MLNEWDEVDKYMDKTLENIEKVEKSELKWMLKVSKNYLL